MKKLEKYLPFFLLFPSLLLIFGLTLYPLVYSVYMSFTNLDLITGEELRFVGLYNYFKLLRDPLVANSFQVSLFYSAFTVSAEILLGIALALSIYSLNRGRKFMMTIVTMNMAATPVCLGLLYKFFFNDQIGLANYLLSLVGISKVNWLGDIYLAPITVGLVDIWTWTGFIALIILAARATLPTGVYDAAALDGASSFQIFRKITLPMLKPAILLAFLLRLMDNFKIFDHILMMTRGGPMHPYGATDVLSVVIYRTAAKHYKLAYAFSISWVYLAIFMVLVYISFRIIKIRV